MSKQPEYRTFDFSGETLATAGRLIGCRLLRVDQETGNILASGRIVETEAYLADDPASHSFNGRTPRNRAMFMDAGHIYVYRIYGIHCCVNVVTMSAGVGEAVLIRALEPLTGLGYMWEGRYGSPMPDSPDDREIRGLCSGPGKLTRSLGVDVDGFNGHRFGISGPLDIAGDESAPDGTDITAGPRLGIRKGRGDRDPYRYCLPGSRYLSRPAGGEAPS